MHPKHTGLFAAAFALVGCSSAGTPTLQIVAPTAARHYVAADGALSVDLQGGCAGAAQKSLRITQNGKVVAEVAAIDGQPPTSASVPLTALTLQGLPAAVGLAARLECDSDLAADAPEVVFSVFPTARDLFETPADTTVRPVHGGRFLSCGFAQTTLLAADGHALAEGPRLDRCDVEGEGDLFIARAASTVHTLVPDHSLVYDATLRLLWNGETTGAGGTTTVVPGQGLAHAVGGRLVAFPPGLPMTVVELDRTSGTVLSTLTLPFPAEVRELTPLGRPWSRQGGAIGLLLRVHDAEGLRYVALDVDFSETTAHFTQATVAELARTEDGNPLVESSAVMLGDDTALLLETRVADRTKVEVKTLALGTRAVASVANLDGVQKTWAFRDRVLVLRSEVVGAATRHVLDQFVATGLAGTLALDAALAPPAWLEAHEDGGLFVMAPATPNAVTWFDGAFAKIAEFERAPHFDGAGTGYLQVVPTGGGAGRLVQLETAAQALARKP